MNARKSFQMFAKPLLGLGIATIAFFPQGAWAIDPPTNIMTIDRTKARDAYLSKCSSCHDQPSDRTPSREAISSTGPDNIVRALTEGVMQPMAAGMTPAEIDAIALYLTGTLPLPRVAAGPDANLCPSADPIRTGP